MKLEVNYTLKSEKRYTANGENTEDLKRVTRHFL